MIDSKKLLRAVLLALALVSATVVVPAGAPTREAVAQAPSDGKLNYYRERGSDPWCEDPCDRTGRCCKY